MRRSSLFIQLLLLVGFLSMVTLPSSGWAYDLYLYGTPTVSGTLYSTANVTSQTLTVQSQVRCAVLSGSTTDSCPASFTVAHRLYANGASVETFSQNTTITTGSDKRSITWVPIGTFDYTPPVGRTQTYAVFGLKRNLLPYSINKLYQLPDPGAGLQTRTYTFSVQVSGHREVNLPIVPSTLSTASFGYTLYSGNLEYNGAVENGVLASLTEGSSPYCPTYQYFPGITENSTYTSWWNTRFYDRNLCAKKIVRNGMTDLMVVSSLNISSTPTGPTYGYAIRDQPTGTAAVSNITITASGTLPRKISIHRDLMKGASQVKRETRQYSTFTWHDNGANASFTAGSPAYPLPATGPGASQMQTATNYRFNFTAADTNALSVDSPVVSTSFFPYTVFSGNLDFNSVHTTMTAAQYHNTACTGGDYTLYSVNGNWGHVLGQSSYTATSLCTTGTANSDGYSVDLRDYSGSATVSTVSGANAGMDFRLTDVTLDKTGGLYTGAELTLPDSVTVHPLINTEIWPRGEKVVVFPGGTFSSRFDAGPFHQTGAMYFHGHDLPFYVYSPSVSLDLARGDGLQFTTPQGVYVHASATSELAATDLRSTRGLPSNDSVFGRGQANTANTATINGSGLSAALLFGGSTGKPVRQTSFPRAVVGYDNWAVFVVDGRLTNKTELISPRFTMTFNRNCPGGACAEENQRAVYRVQSDRAGLHPSGIFGAQFSDLGDPLSPSGDQGVEWGGFELNRPTFARQDQGHAGVWLVPGFILEGTANTPGNNKRLPQVLLGSVRFTGPTEPSQLFPLHDANDSTATDGDGFFAGINLGPEILVGGDSTKPHVDAGFGSLLRNQTALRFYGNTEFVKMDDLDSTKYVLRPGGLTGVFNTRFSSDTGGPVRIYGYDLFFSRFAFRQDRNQLDGDTFIDGDLTMHGPVGGSNGMKVGFRNLDLTCNGNLGNGDVDSEPEPEWATKAVGDGVDGDGDGFIDEGSQILRYWNMPIFYKGMAFANDPDIDALSGDCPTEPKKLQMTTANFVEGIKQPLTMKALYTPSGTLENQTVTGSVNTWFDKPQEGTQGGFTLRLQKAYLNEVSATPPAWDGFMTLAGLTDVPLFNDTKLSGHFVNNPISDPLNITDYSLYIFKDETDLDTNFNGAPDAYDANIVDLYRKRLETDGNDPVKPHFEYSWPTSDMVNLSYWADYNRSVGSDMPQFLGIKKESDILGVIKVNSVPDYINPQRTKFSFGASADLAALKNFQVDLNNLPGGIDTFLQNNLGVSTSFSLEDILGDLVNAEQIMHDLTGGDLTFLFGEIIDTALQGPGVNTAINNAASMINQAHQAPYQIVGALIDPLEEAQARLTRRITDTLTKSMDDLYTKYSSFVLYNKAELRALYTAENPDSLPDPAAKFDEMAAQVDRIRDDLVQTIDTVDNTLQKVQAAVNVLGGAQGKINEIKGFVSQAQGRLNDLHDVLNSDLAGFLDPSPFANPLLQTLDDAKSTVTTVKNTIKAVDLGLIGQALQTAATLSGSSLDTSMLDSAQETIDTAINQLEDVIQDADSSIQSLYASLPLSDLLVQIDTLIAPTGVIQTSLGQLGTALSDVSSILATVTSLAQNEMTTVSSHLKTIRDYLTNQEIPTASPTWAEMQADGQLRLDNLAASLLATVPDGNLGNIVSGITGADFRTVFHDNLQAIIMAPIKEILDDYGPNGIRTQLNLIIEKSVGLLPNPTPQDIRNMIRAQLLNSDAVEEINELFFEQFGFVSDMVDDVALQLTAQVNNLIKETIDAVNEGLSESLAGVTAGIGADAGWSGINSAGIDGYAIVSQDEVEKIHMEAEFEMDGDPDPTTYNAALDVTVWNADNGKAACAPAGSSNYDVTISTHDVKADMLGLPVGIKTASLGFSMQATPNIKPLSVFGNVYLLGEINFEALILEDLGLESGLGIDGSHNPIIYFGATGAGRFQDYSIPKAAFYLGRTCDFEVLRRLDSEAADFIGEIVPLTGVYARGSVDVPIYNMGCMFKIGVGADIGVWYFTNPSPGTYGGLVGGSAYGKLACLASLKGKITTMGQKSGSTYKFAGDGWAAAGVGSCSPSKWKKVSDARKDSWCLTGDAQFGAEYNNGWDIDGPSVHCCD